MSEATKSTVVLPEGAPWAINQVRQVRFHLSTVDIIVDCLVLDKRVVYGRTEYQITPVAGKGSAWVSEKGPTVMSKNKQSRHEREDTP